MLPLNKYFVLTKWGIPRMKMRKRHLWGYVRVLRAMAAGARDVVLVPSVFVMVGV